MAPRRTRFDILPLTEPRWDDLVSVFEQRGPRGGMSVAGQCWCAYWRLPRAEFNANWPPRGAVGTRNRAVLRAALEAGQPTGLLAYEHGHAVGWIAVAPREHFPRLEASRPLARPDDAPVWSVVCFVVDARNRRTGVAAALLDGAIEYARSGGADYLEAYGCRRDDEDPFTGHESLFAAAGFEVIKRHGRRALMRHPLR
jgi:GNAT superfamily N-acetyltransferase